MSRLEVNQYPKNVSSFSRLMRAISFILYVQGMKSTRERPIKRIMSFRSGCVSISLVYNESAIDSCNAHMYGGTFSRKVVLDKFLLPYMSLQQEGYMYFFFFLELCGNEMLCCLYCSISFFPFFWYNIQLFFYMVLRASCHNVGSWTGWFLSLFSLFISIILFFTASHFPNVIIHQNLSFVVKMGAYELAYFFFLLIKYPRRLVI